MVDEALQTKMAHGVCFASVQAVAAVTYHETRRGVNAHVADALAREEVTMPDCGRIA
jgi:hypothetical protein